MIMLNIPINTTGHVYKAIYTYNYRYILCAYLHISQSLGGAKKLKGLLHVEGTTEENGV